MKSQKKEHLETEETTLLPQPSSPQLSPPPSPSPPSSIEFAGFFNTLEIENFCELRSLNTVAALGAKRNTLKFPEIKFDEKTPPSGFTGQDLKNCLIVNINAKDPKSKKYVGISYIDHLKNKAEEIGSPVLLEGEYSFVRMLNNEMRLYKLKDGINQHAFLSGSAQQVRYAGTITFDQGKILRWTNGSSCYAPEATNKTNADLPLGSSDDPLFHSYNEKQANERAL